MARTKIKKPTPALNYRGVPYPFDEDFMRSLGYVIAGFVRRHQDMTETTIRMSSEEILHAFVEPEHRAMCREAPSFYLGSAFSSEFTFSLALPSSEIGTTLPVTMNCESPKVALPKYVTRGPLHFNDGPRTRIRMGEAVRDGLFIKSEWMRVYCMVSTLNYLCKSVGDILANFPALELLAKDSDMLRSYLLGKNEPVRHVTKIPVELRAEYKEVTRTVTRTTLLSPVMSTVREGLWTLHVRDVRVAKPEWYKHSPGIISL